MKRLPHWTILCVTLGAFLLPIMGGHLSIEAGRILPTDNLLLTLLNGEETPFLTHFLVSLLFFVPMTANLFTHKISHVVNLRITSWLAIFGACIGVSIVVSSFPAVTILNILEWTMMSLAFFAVTLCCGRKHAIYPALGFVVGVTLTAILGIYEFGQLRVIDPGYRIFALQVGPNQTGALFASSSILTLALALRFDRLPRLALVLAGLLQAFALFLTQSKGAVLCLPIGILTALVAILILKPVKPATALGVLLIPVLIGGFLATTAQRSAASQAGSTAVSRLTDGSGEAAQSAGFRKLLWESAIDLTKKHPYGWGLGSFWYESTRPGRVTQTTLAHQTYLQLACEASPLAPVALLGFLGSVIIWGFRGIRNLPDDSKLLLVGVLGALAVALAHNCIDSDMYIFGLGSLVFLLSGAFTTTSADSQAPEFIFSLPKMAYAATALLLIPLTVSVGLAEMYRSEARGSLSQGDREGIQSAANAAISVTFADGQAYALRALADPNESDLQTAAQFHPSPKTYRALAEYYARNGKIQDCFRALEKALERDPNNAAALKLYFEVAAKAGDDSIGKQKALQLLDTEKTTYFTVRSQPEFIPTETYVARLYLSKLSTDDKEKAQYLADAIKGFAEYRDKTGPVVVRTLAGSSGSTIAGEDKGTLTRNYNLAESACRELIPLQRRLGLALGVDPEAEAAKFATALESLNK